MTDSVFPRADIETLLKLGKELGFAVEELTYAQQIHRCGVQLVGFQYTVTAFFRWLERGSRWALVETYVEVSEESTRVYSVEATCERLRAIADPHRP